MDITKLLLDYNDLNSAPNFMQVIEDHLGYFKTTSNLFGVVVTDQQNEMFKGDFYGLLNALAINPMYHYYVMRLNGITNSAMYPGDLHAIAAPDFEEFNLIRATYKTKAN